MRKVLSDPWVPSGAILTLAALHLSLWSISWSTPIGQPVPPSVAHTLRGGDDEEVACGWLKSAECKYVAGSTNYSTCPAQTFYYSGSEGEEYAKPFESHYCGTQREGNPQIYDCTVVFTETAGCAK